MFFYRNPLKWVKNLEISASSTGDVSEDHFGHWIQPTDDGEILFVGQINSFGYNGGTENTDSVGGSVYVFRKQGEEYEQIQRIVAPTNDVAGEHFTFNIGSNLSGTKIVVGDASRDYDSANGAEDYHGAIYVYESGSSGYALVQEIQPQTVVTYGSLGMRVAMDATGTKMFASTYENDVVNYGGSVSVYESGSSGFQYVQELTANDPDGSPEGDWFVMPRVSRDGNTLFVGSYGDEEGADTAVGAVYVFQSGSSGYQQVQKLEPSNHLGQYEMFGYISALNEDDSIFAASAYARNHDGTVNGNYRMGTVVIYESGSNGWQETQTIDAPVNDGGVNAYNFGIDISISGSYLAIGSELDWRTAEEKDAGGSWRNKGAVYIYERVDGTYQLKHRIVQEGERNTIGYFSVERGGFGYSVELLPNDELLVGSPRDDLNGTDSGVVYKYKLTRDY